MSKYQVDNPASLFWTHILRKISPISWAGGIGIGLNINLQGSRHSPQSCAFSSVFRKGLSTKLCLKPVRSVCSNVTAGPEEGISLGEEFPISLPRAWASVSYFIQHSKCQYYYIIVTSCGEYKGSLCPTSEKHVLFLVLFSTAKIRAQVSKPRAGAF